MNFQSDLDASVLKDCSRICKNKFYETFNAYSIEQCDNLCQTIREFNCLRIHTIIQYYYMYTRLTLIYIEQLL